MNAMLRLGMVLVIGALSVGFRILSDDDKAKAVPPEDDLATMLVYGFSDFGSLEVDTAYLQSYGGTMFVLTGKTEDQKKKEFRMQCSGFDMDGNGIQVHELDEIGMSQRSARQRSFSESVRATRRVDGDWDVFQTRQDETRRTEEGNIENYYIVPEEEVLRSVHDLMLEFDGRAPVRPQRLYVREQEVILA
jgi:hypothetical protein